jgi:hypothetical protein
VCLIPVPCEPRSILAVKPRSISLTGAQAVKLFEIEIGRSYKCDLYEGQYLGTVKGKRDGHIGVVLGGKVGTPDQADTLCLEELVWLAPGHVHPL